MHSTGNSFRKSERDVAKNKKRAKSKSEDDGNSQQAMPPEFVLREEAASSIAASGAVPHGQLRMALPNHNSSATGRAARCCCWISSRLVLAVAAALASLTCLRLDVPEAAGLSSVPVLPVPKGKSYLPFQRESIQTLVCSNRILLADEMGLGKTISVIGALNALLQQDEDGDDSDEKEQPPIRRVLVICPKTVIPNWDYELKNWLISADESAKSGWTTGIATAEKGLPSNLTNVLLINYDIVEKFRDELDRDWAPFDVVVCDEAHYLKNADAIRTKAVLGRLVVEEEARNRKRKRKKERRALSTQRLWLLTGSPLMNNPSELYTLLRAIDPQFETIPELKSLEGFSDRYSNRRESPWGVTYRGGRNLPELRQRLKATRKDGTPLMIRRRKAQVLKDLPPKRHQLLPLWDDGNRAATDEFERVQFALQSLSTKLEKRESSSKKDGGSFSEKTVPELRELLMFYGLDSTGRKKELVERLQEHAEAVREENVAREEDQGEGFGKETDRDDGETTVESEPGIYSSAQSALRSQQGRAGGSEILQEMLRVLNRKGINATRSDSDAIRGLLASARHETARLKVPHAIDLIKNSIESHKVVVFAYHRDVQTAVRAAFAETAVGIMGGDSLEERAEAVRRFQEDPSVRVFVGSIKAAGTGITLSAASHVIFVEMDWSPLVVQQAEDRCHRVGQKGSVLIQYLYFQNTIDEHLVGVLAAKQSAVTAAIDEAEGPASWLFDFGKHDGLCVADVAGSDPAYLEWLAETDVITRKPMLASALEELGFLSHHAVGSEPDLPVDNGVKIPAALKESSVVHDAATGVANFQFDFGKHAGKGVVDVAQIDPSYLTWLVKRGAHHNRLDLESALLSLGFLDGNDRASPESLPEEFPTTTARGGLLSQSGSFTLQFGKHKGQRLDEVPLGYLRWLESSGATRRNPLLAASLEKHLAERDTAIYSSRHLDNELTDET